MAKGTKNVVRIPVQTFEEKVVGVTLELTLEEAEVLYFISRRIGGSPSGPRGCMDSINEALLKCHPDIDDTRKPNIDGSLHIYS